MREWPALGAFRDWLSDELDPSRNELRSAKRPSATAKAGRAANR